jgi:hypothetical protein
MSIKSSSFTILNKNKYAYRNLSVTWPVTIFVLLLVLFIAFRFWNITAFSIWGGEAFSMIGVEKNWGEMFTYIVEDIVHPPLFYILLKVWILIGGSSLFWLKLFPVITGIAVVVPFLLLCRELNFRLPETNLALLMLTVNGYLVHYAQELRMYSLFMFLAMCSFWLFIRYFKTPGPAPKQLILLTIVNLMAIYSHYYGWVVVGMELLFLLIWQRKRVLEFSFTGVILLLCFSPWAYLVVREALSIGGLEKNLDWIPKPGITSILNLYVTFNGPLGDRFIKIFGLLIFGLPLLIWAGRLYRNGLKTQKDELMRFSWLVLLAFLPVGFLFLISQKMDQAVWIDRYFIFIAIPYMMLVAASVSRIKPVWLRNLWIGIIVTFSLLAGFNDIRTNRIAWESPQLGSRLNWYGIVQELSVGETKNTSPINIYSLTVISNGYRTGDWAISMSLDYFLDKIGDTRFQVVYGRDAGTLIERVEEDYFWIAYFEIPAWPKTPPRLIFAGNGFRVGESISSEENNNRFVMVPVWRE